MPLPPENKSRVTMTQNKIKVTFSAANGVSPIRNYLQKVVLQNEVKLLETPLFI